MTYQRTHEKLVLPVAMGVAAVILIVTSVISSPPATIAAAVFGLAALIVFGVSRLTTTVTDEAVEVAFRFGWPRRVIARSEIVTATAVRNKWWYGWGIRWIPEGTLWNVWGLDAVELRLVDGRRFRIGTDEPAGLAAAIVGEVGESCWGL